MRFLVTFLVVLFCSPIFAQDDFTVNVHEISDPDGLNPLTSKAANAKNIEDNIFCRLLEYNRQTFELEPALAKKRPVVTEIEEGKYKGGMSLAYEIHASAKWDNGTPVTGTDYAFTVKAVKHQKVESGELRHNLEFIDEVVIDEAYPNRFTIYSKKRFFMAEVASGNLLHVIPEYVYDPNQVMRGVTIAELNAKKAKDYDEKLNAFSEKFNGFEYAKEEGSIVGCGPYKLIEWTSGITLELERKKDWWGDNIKNNDHLKAYPSKIVYKIIPGIAWVLPKMKEGELDIIRNVPPSKFFEAQKDEEYTKIVDFYTPSQFVYHYLAFNTKSPKLSDKRVREAIAHAVDRDFIVNELFGGEAVKLNTPISPNKSYYNKNIEGVSFDVEKSKSLLTKAGWKDSDGDGVLDKKVEGKLVKLRLKYNYNNGNLVRKAIGEMLKKNLAKINVKVDLYPIDFPTLLENASKRNYEIIALAWVNSPGVDDLKHIWHTSSDTEEGGNRVGFGNPKTDKIIDDIRQTLDAEQRKKLYHEIQQKIVDEHPYVFLVVPHELIMVRKGFAYPKLGPVSPGYVTRLFQKK